MAGYFAAAPAATADVSEGSSLMSTDVLHSVDVAEGSVLNSTDIVSKQVNKEADADDYHDDADDAPIKEKAVVDDDIDAALVEAKEAAGKRVISLSAASECSTAAPSSVRSGNMLAQGGTSSSWSVHMVEASEYVDTPWKRPIGTDINAFQVLSILGKGSFGVVYKVSEKVTGQIYAMKVLQKEQLFGKNILRYALTEKNVQATMDHPFIVGLACTFQTPSVLVLVMQYCSGGSLEKLVKSQGRLPEDVSRLYFSEIFLAIEHLHSCEVIYRDLKCENVVLDDWGHAMLTDFGLAKENAVGTRATGTFVGSIAYATPEVLKSQLHGTPVDVYGLGVVLYEMLTGLPPYYALSQKKLFDNIQHAKLTLPELASDECKLILRELLRREPERRLGALRTSDIRAHAWLAGVDFEAVLRREAAVALPGQGRSKTADANALANGCRAVEPFKRKLTLRRRHVEGWEFPAPAAAPRGAGCLRMGCLVGRGNVRANTL